MSKPLALVFLLAVVPLAGAARAATCHDGSVIHERSTDPIVVTWKSEDAAGKPIEQRVEVEPETRITPSVVESHERDEATGRYTYRYVLTNAASSAQQIWYVNIQLDPRTAPTADQATTGGQGWQFSERDQNCGGIAFWFLTSEAVFEADHERGGLKPGESMTFSFTSDLPPGPMALYMRGNAETIASFPEDGPPPCVTRLLDEQRGFPTGYVKVMTTGPAAPK